MSGTSKARDFPGAKMVDSWFSSAKQPASVIVAEGQRVSYEVDGTAGVPQATSSALASDWIHGFLIYTSKPLHEVIEDVQRYYARPIELDPAVANLNYSGTFLQKNVDGWLHNLSAIFPVEIIDEDSKIVIRPRKSSGG